MHSYGTDGRILPAFRVHVDPQKEVAADLRKLANHAHDLRLRLETVRGSKQEGASANQAMQRTAR